MTIGGDEFCFREDMTLRLPVVKPVASFAVGLSTTKPRSSS